MHLRLLPGSIYPFWQFWTFSMNVHVFAAFISQTSKLLLFLPLIEALPRKPAIGPKPRRVLAGFGHCAKWCSGTYAASRGCNASELTVLIGRYRQHELVQGVHGLVALRVYGQESCRSDGVAQSSSHDSLQHKLGLSFALKHECPSNV